MRRSRGFTRRVTYDALRRATGVFVMENGVERLAERTTYGELQGEATNHRGRAYQQFDAAGVRSQVREAAAPMRRASVMPGAAGVWFRFVASGGEVAALTSWAAAAQLEAGVPSRIRSA